MDLAIVERARRGDAEAFDMLVRVEMPGVYRRALTILGSEADARDAAQETFVAAWRELPRLRDPERFEAWFGRIGLNACRMAIRRRGRVREIPAEAIVAGCPSPDGSRAVVERDILSRAFGRLQLAGLMAAVAVLVVGIGIALLATHASPSPTGPGASPSSASTASELPASPMAVGPDGFPTEAFGLPVLSIAEARPKLDPARGPVVVAVKGYLSAGYLADISCPLILAGTERLSQCGTLRWFTATPQQVTIDGTGTSAGPTGVSLSPIFPWPDQLPVPDAPMGSSPALGSTPRPVVLVGHVDDPLASRCDPASSCARLFVVDAVAWANSAPAAPYRGSDLSGSGPGLFYRLPASPDPAPPSASSSPRPTDGSVTVRPGDPGIVVGPLTSGGPIVGPGPMAAAGAAEAAVQSRVADFTTLASIAVAGDRLASYDPRLPGSDAELAAPAVTWLVRGWEAGPDGVVRLATYAVPDADVETVIRVAGSGLTVVPPAHGTPRTFDGLPIITVAEAPAARDDPARTTPEPLAVAGWYQPAPAAPCPAHPCAQPALAPACPAGMAALMASPEDLYPAGGSGWHAPTGPSITPRFLTGNAGSLPGVGSTTGPVLAVLVGHFHDPAAAECSAVDRPTCEQFVVERVEPLARAVPAPTDDWRLSCHKADCEQAAAEVAVADPLSYADAERIAVVGRCAPWMRCPLDRTLITLLVPTGWSGDPGSLGAWQAASGTDATWPVTPFTAALTDDLLAQAGGYTVACTGSIGPDCYRAAVAAARRDGDPLEITDTHIATDSCGSGWLRRADGTSSGWQADSAQPNGPNPSPSPSPSPSPAPTATPTAAFPAQVDGRTIDPVAAAQAIVAQGGYGTTSDPAAIAVVVRAAYPSTAGRTITSMTSTGDDPRTVVLPELDRSRPNWLVGLIRFGGSPPVTPETRTVLVADATTTVRVFPDWPVHLDPAVHLPTVTATDSAGHPVTCLDVVRADCLAAVAKVAAADPATISVAGQVTVVPGCPPWDSWGDPAFAAVRLVGITPSSTSPDGWVRSFLLAGSGPATELPGGTTPAWLERAVYQLKGAAK